MGTVAREHSIVEFGSTERKQGTEEKESHNVFGVMDPLPAALRWRATAIPFLVAVLLLSTVSTSRAIYCDEDDCYDLLGSANIPFLPSIVFNLSLISHCNAPSSHSQGFSECQCFRNQESLLQTLLEAVRVSPP